MEAIKKQASKLREQVAKQQQAILRQLGHLGQEAVMIDEAGIQCHQQLQNLYKSTRAAKHFQKDIVRGVEGFITTGKKQMEIARKLAEDCCKYGIENQDADTPLARAALDFGTSHTSMEDQRETMLGILGYQVSEPLRASINGAPLEDARHLTRCYDKMQQEFEIQAAEVIRRQSKSRDSSAESIMKLKSAETKLSELKSSMLALGREANVAMLSVEDQQQHITFQKLLTTVNAERSYHQNVVSILEKLHCEMIAEEQLNDSSPKSEILRREVNIPCANKDTASNGSGGQENEDRIDALFIAKVIHSFDGQADGELTLEVNDYVVVRQMAPNGWSEGECNGKAGWFPSAYVERIEKIPVGKIAEDDCPP
ncbi:SH3 domain-containing 1 [Olea europaea subsp. europaea]|uniref:SH3 domain-containing 1 n=1 Tax=Olea europaea subsp. europaea TaxID=158383 RepID=A0A8S0SRE4_OLEEU|nr:SH3 domain-containing 1 [Olea europaea subsp. europaea]